MTLTIAGHVCAVTDTPCRGGCGRRVVLVQLPGARCVEADAVCFPCSGAVKLWT